MVSELQGEEDKEGMKEIYSIFIVPNPLRYHPHRVLSGV